MIIPLLVGDGMPLWVLPYELDPKLMRIFQALREEIGPVPVTSEFRCDAHNNLVSKVK